MRVKTISRVRTRIISPRTPRSSGSVGARGEAAAIDDDPRLGTDAPRAFPSRSACRPRQAAKRARSARMPRADRDGLRRRRTDLYGSARRGPARARRSALRPRARWPAGARGEALDLADVARRRDDQRAGARRRRERLRVPPVDRAGAKLDHARRRALALADTARACRRQSHEAVAAPSSREPLDAAKPAAPRSARRQARPS